MEDNKVAEYLNRQDIIIEGSMANWEIRVEGDIQGLYTGNFKFRCFLTPTQRLAAGREYRELLGSNPTLATKHDDSLALALSQLKYRVISAPPFWTSNSMISGWQGDVPDDVILDTVLEAAIASELKYRAQVKQKKVDAIERAKKAAQAILKAQQEEGQDAGENQETGD